MTIFEELGIPADRISLPADRISLVKRNVELKKKLEQRGRALREIAETIHGVFDHPGTFDTCERADCSGVRAILKLTEAS